MGNTLSEEFDTLLESEELEENDEHSKILVSMLGMIDPKHSIIVDDTIGLIGDNELDVDYNYKENGNKLYDVWNTQCNYKVFNHFQAITNEGVFLFNEYCNGLGIIEHDGVTIGYMFLLEKFFTNNSIDDFFNENTTSNAIVLSFENSLFTNSLEIADTDDNKKFKVYTFDNTIDFIDKHSLVFRKHQYLYHPLDKKNNIFILRYNT